MATSTIRVVIVYPLRDPPTEVREVPNTPEALQEIIGAPYETLRLPGGLAILFAKPSRPGIVVHCGEGVYTSVTDRDISEIPFKRLDGCSFSVPRYAVLTSAAILLRALR